jgi:hypothetical protein
MMQSARLERIRQLVEETFDELAQDATAPVRETILVQNGHYCGRRFTCGRLQAIWFVEEGELKFYGEDGSVFKMTTSDAAADDEKRAA